MLLLIVNVFRNTNLRWIAWLAICGPLSQVMWQSPVTMAQDVITTTALKPVSPVTIRSAGQYLGVTKVQADSKLESILRGGELRTAADLMAMQTQQTKVAQKIQAVTVSIQRGRAQGSGVIITPDGYVLTAAHVAGKPGQKADLILSDGRRVRGQTLGMNRSMDAALVKIEAPNSEAWPHASLGTSSKMSVGQWCIAEGHHGGWMPDRPAPFRLGQILSTKDASTIVTDCKLIGGDSGGPLFDLEGQLIGIHSRIGTDVTDNMHVPIDVYSKYWDRLAAGEAWGTLPGYKPVIGIEGIKTDPRAIVGNLVKDGPADKAGLQVGDIIRSFDGSEIKTFDDLKSAVDGTLPSDRVRMIIEREGVQKRLQLTIGQGG